VTTDPVNGYEETTLTYSIANADSAQYALDGGAWTTASASGAPAAIVLPADGNDHALQLRARRTSDGAVDSTPASSTLKICPQAGCGAPPPTAGAFPRLGMLHYVIADDAQAQMLARWDWFTTSTADPGSVQRTPLVMSLNPGIKYVPYLDASEDNGWPAEPDCSTPTTTASGFRDEWFVRNADGSYATRSYSGSRKQLNITQFAQVVNGKSWNDHLAAWVARCQVGVSDGTVLDLISDTGSGLWGAWSVAGVFSDQVDLDRNGEADRYESGKGNAWIDDQWGEGAKLLMSKVRAAVGNHPLVPSNGTGLNTNANGFVFEGGSTDDNGVNLFRTWMTDHYGSGEHMSLAITPAGLHGGTQTSYKLMRHNLGAAMLAGAYFGYADGNGPNGGYSSLWWYDEYSVDRTTGQATGDATAKGYLGLPTGDAVRAANGVWRRDFDNGIVLVNNTTSEQTTDLGGTFRRISGVQDPAHNDGASVTSQTLAGQDAIILLR
jgi:putative glycosyl hydrolase-like family 15 (GHL15) protein